MAFVNMKQCFNSPKQYIRFLVVVACICLSLYQLNECIRKLLQPPISTHYGFFLNQTMRYPSVTICRDPPYKSYLYENFGFDEKTDIRYATFWKNFTYEQSNVDDFFNNVTYDYEEVFGFTALDQWEENLQIESVVFLEYGKCFKFSPKNSSIKWGSDFGYNFYFNPEEEDELKGFFIFLHDEKQIFTEKKQADIFMESIYVTNEDNVKINLKLIKYNQISTTKKKCENNPNYSISKCLDECVNNLLTTKVGCSTIWIPNKNRPACNRSSQLIDLVQFSRPSNYLDQFVDQCDNECPIACNTTIYTPIVMSRVKNANSIVNIYFSTNLYAQMQEIIGYDWHGFLADLGGSLGFLLGLSVLGAISLIEKMILMIVNIKRSNGRIENNCNQGEKY